MDLDWRQRGAYGGLGGGLQGTWTLLNWTLSLR